jgi:hypothetical protein
MCETESPLSKLNYILHLQEMIRTECNTLIEEQAASDDLKAYTERQTVLNKLYTQYMELGLKATGLIIAAGSLAADEIGVSISSTEDTEDGLELSARTLSVAEDSIRRTASSGDAPSVDD